MKIGVKEIRVDLAVSIREKNDEEAIERYMEVLGDLPPITVFHSDDKYLLADGFHRWAAAERLGWEYINAEVIEGSYEEASEYAATANLKHGKPLTSEEYERALKRLKKLHEDWTQEKLAKTLNRSQQWVSEVFAAESVEKIPAAGKLDTNTKAEISRAPKRLWVDICKAAQEQEWTREEIREKVKGIKAEPERAQEIIKHARIEVPEAPADKLIPLTKEINKLCDMLDPSLYDWGSGALAVHVLHGLYVLGDKTMKMIAFLEGRKENGGEKKEGDLSLE